MMKAWLGPLLVWAGVVQAADMSVVRYVDQDPGDPAYATRILVTPDFLRMDGGEDAGDFVLLDRRQRKVVNVMRDNKLALVFVPARLPAQPANLKARLATQPGAAGTRRFTLTVNGAVCSEGVAARRAAPDVARAMAELKAILAATQYRVWRDSPRELRHDCDLANHVWDSGATLKLGLPLEERDFSGRSRQFESESSEPLRPELFRVPDGIAAVNAPS
jgi:hypothetical protein